MPWNATDIDSQILAVHAAVVPAGSQGEVILFGGDEHWSAQQESASPDGFKKTRVYDVATHSIVGASIPSPDSDVFCSHHAFAADGRLLIAGGTHKWPEGGDIHAHQLDFIGHSRCWVYSPRGRRWVEVSRLNRNPDQLSESQSGGRWYPGCVTLGNGDVFACFGHPGQQDFRHRNVLPERYNQGGNAWINSPKAMAEPHAPGGGVRYLFYPRAFVLRDGKLFFATPMPAEFDPNGGDDGTYFSTRYDPATGDYVGHKIPEPAGYGDWSYPAVMLPLLPEEDYRPRVLFCGRTNPLKIDLGDANGEWTATAGRDPAVSGLTRTYSNAAILPNGKVCLVGGVNVVDPEEPVSQAEIYEPGIDWAAGSYTAAESWTLDAGAAAHTRNYHSTALLLPNGKVWVAGGNDNANSGDPNVVGVKRIELFEPDYIAVANRIQIQSAPPIPAYGASIEIEIDRPATNVQRVALIRNGSATHSTNNDQRYVGLPITARNGNTLTVTAPPNGNVAPPGYYMLWVIDTNGNPCQLARFVRLAHAGCSVFTDRSTFAQEEVESIGGGGQTTISNAVYLYVDGYIASELTATPTVELHWDDTGDPIPGAALRLIGGPRLLEVDPPDPEVPQRITFPFHVRFPNLDAFAGIVDQRQVRMTFRIGPHTCVETIDLTKSPNPYMIDVDSAIDNPGWLSTDVRVFVTTEGGNFAGVPHGSGPGSQQVFLRALLDNFNFLDELPSHPFRSIPQGQNQSPLVLATSLLGLIRFQNYAIARVRYRAQTTTAQRVKAFFRLFNTVGTALDYNTQTTYRHTGPGAGTVPLIGHAGGELISIPFFLSERVETIQGQPGATSMASQPLDANYEIKDIAPDPGTEVTMYFGCWLDINQTRKRFPLSPGSSDGPWPDVGSRSVQELMRGRHQCLVAEIYFEQDPTADGETPGSSDNLSQRNLSILFSDNPGGPDSHTVMHTFEVKPSSIPAQPPDATVEAVPLAGQQPHLMAAGGEQKRRLAPDELFFRWHNLPSNTEVTVHFSDVDTNDMSRLAARRLSPPPFTVIDKHTIRFRAGDVASVPLPGGRELHIPALLEVKLPDTVAYGEEYRLSVHQIDGPSQRVIGAFEFAIPVSKAELILEEETSALSVLKHIGTTIPFSNHWYPIFQKYLHGLSAKLDALGGDSSSVHPNPDGSGQPYVPPRPEAAPSRWCLEGWAVSLVVAATLVLLGVVASAGARGVVAAVGVVATVLLVRAWASRCCGRLRCALLDHLALGSAVAAAVLTLLIATDVNAGFLGEAAAVAALIAGVSIALSFVLRCRGSCCDDECSCCGDGHAHSGHAPPRFAPLALKRPERPGREAAVDQREPAQPELGHRHLEGHVEGGAHPHG